MQYDAEGVCFRSDELQSASESELSYLGVRPTSSCSVHGVHRAPCWNTERAMKGPDASSLRGCIHGAVIAR